MDTVLSNQWARLMAGGDGAGADAATGVRVVAWHVRAACSEWVSQAWLQAQTQAGWPAPAIAVDGHDGWLLCFALPSAQPPAQTLAVLRELIQAWLQQVGVTVSPVDAAAWRFTCWPQDLPADGVPVPRQVGPDRWSAFVAPDLVPVFAESPWLDCAPGEEGQAALLSKLQPIPVADWSRLRATLAQGAAVQPLVGEGSEVVAGARDATGPREASRAFLLSVMNDASVDLALRIEAARVLLAHG